MSKLIKNAVVIDPDSPDDGKKVDIFLQQGKISKIGKALKDKATQTIDASGAYLSPGWVDALADYCEPGYEYKETIQTGLNAAKAGGFSEVIIVPNTLPAITNAATMEFVRQKAANHSVKMHIAGALSKNIEGKELAEMMDMHHSGALAFSDGWQPLQDAMLMLKAMEYVKAFDGLIIQIPIHASLSTEGFMNESATSVKLGMSSIPAMSESLLIHRDLELLRYTQSKIHFSGITTAASVKLIRDAKKEGLQVSCSVTPYHLLYDDTLLKNYDSNFKVNPPLRTEKDRKALIKAVKDEIIDCISSHHRPQDIDSKNKEFAYAGWGMNTQETCWSMLQLAIPDLEPEQWVQLLSINPRKIFNLKPASIRKGEIANFTLFDKKTEWLFDARNKQSIGINNPLLGKTLKGKATAL